MGYVAHERGSPPRIGIIIMGVVSITDKAAAEVLKRLSDNPDAIGVKLGTRAYGCSGLGYTLDYVTDIDPTDELVEDKGVKLFVDRKSLLFILGTQMDWEDSTFSTGFSFKNPNEAGRCGCGESFMVDAKVNETS